MLEFSQYSANLFERSPIYTPVVDLWSEKYGEKYIDFEKYGKPTTSEVVVAKDEKGVQAALGINTDRITYIAGNKDSVVDLINFAVKTSRVEPVVIDPRRRHFLWITAHQEAIKMLLTLTDDRLVKRFVSDEDRLIQLFKGIRIPNCEMPIEVRTELIDLGQVPILFQRRKFEEGKTALTFQRLRSYHMSESEYRQLALEFF